MKLFTRFADFRLLISTLAFAALSLVACEQITEPDSPRITEGWYTPKILEATFNDSTGVADILADNTSFNSSLFYYNASAMRIRIEDSVFETDDIRTHRASRDKSHAYFSATISYTPIPRGRTYIEVYLTVP